jgi:hypothetical protein
MPSPRHALLLSVALLLALPFTRRCPECSACAGAPAQASLGGYIGAGALAWFAAVCPPRLPARPLACAARAASSYDM